MTESTSEAIRMIKQGGVRINEEKIIDPKHSVIKGEVSIYQVGKRKFKKITPLNFYLLIHQFIIEKCNSFMHPSVSVIGMQAIYLSCVCQ